jgi:hypothetical protein
MVIHCWLTFGSSNRWFEGKGGEHTDESERRDENQVEGDRFESKQWCGEAE